MHRGDCCSGVQDAVHGTTLTGPNLAAVVRAMSEAFSEKSSLRMDISELAVRLDKTELPRGEGAAAQPEARPMLQAQLHVNVKPKADSPSHSPGSPAVTTAVRI